MNYNKKQNFNQHIVTASKSTPRNLTPQLLLGVMMLMLFMAVLFFILSFNAVSVAANEDLLSADGSTPSETQDTNDFDSTPSTTDPLDYNNLITVQYSEYTENTQDVSNFIDCDYGVLIDLNKHTILAAKNADEKIYPASMTKVMTLIVAYENIKDRTQPFKMTADIINPLVEANASISGLKASEIVPITDLFYGAALPSGADCTCALALCVAESESDFVKLMNDKVQELGLKNTRFMNTTGLHDPNQYSTCHDIAVIMEYAMNIDFLRTVLSTAKYITTPSEKNPEGIELVSTMFSRLRGDEPEIATMIAGKTGYTSAAGHCLVSYATQNDSLASYICVCAKGDTKWEPVYDSINLYKNYILPSPNSTAID